MNTSDYVKATARFSINCTAISKIKNNLLKYRALYIMSFPGILYFFIFKYIPMFGIVIAFQDYNIFKGITGSEFVGFKHFIKLFQYGDFTEILTNTLMINFYDLLFHFSAPIILALIINEVVNLRFKRIVQQVVYLPHFLSWTIMGGIITTQFLSPEYGLVNILLKSLGHESIYFLIKPELARGIVVFAGIWRDTGWGTIIYLAALTAINPNLYEAASIDGASRFKQLLNITLPALLPIITMMFLLKIGNFLDFGFERVWVFMNGAIREKIDIFDTYVYQCGILEGKFDYTTAVGVFKSFAGLILMTIGNMISKKTTGESLY